MTIEERIIHAFKTTPYPSFAKLAEAAGSYDALADAILDGQLQQHYFEVRSRFKPESLLERQLSRILTQLTRIANALEGASR